MSTIPAGAIVRVQVQDAQTSVSPLLNAYDVNDAVSAYLRASGYSVRNSSVSGAIMSTISPLIQETYQAEFLIETPGLDNTDNITSLIYAAFFEVTEKSVSQITIPSFTTPAGTVSTGLPGINTGIGGSVVDAFAGIGTSINNFFSGLKTLGTTLLLGLVAIVILVLVLLAYSPTGKTLAGRIPI